MRTVEQIIEEAKAALTRKRANEAEADEMAERKKREEHVKLWEPIVEQLKDYVPAELHGAISFDADNTPNGNEAWEMSQRTRRPILITLPTPEQYTVFGYWFEDDCFGFAPGALRYCEGEPYWGTHAPYCLQRHEVRALSTFPVALAQTVEEYSPRKPKPAQESTWAPPTITDQLVETLREFIRKEIQNHAESGE